MVIPRQSATTARYNVPIPYLSLLQQLTAPQKPPLNLMGSYEQLCIHLNNLIYAFGERVRGGHHVPQQLLENKLIVKAEK